MHKKLPKIYYFINNFDKNLINNLNSNIALIYRNYNEKFNINLLTDLKEMFIEQKIETIVIEIDSQAYFIFLIFCFTKKSR